jgi:hypothetical protein
MPLLDTFRQLEFYIALIRGTFAAGISVEFLKNLPSQLYAQMCRNKRHTFSNTGLQITYNPYDNASEVV